MPGRRRALDGEALPRARAELREAVLSAPAVGRISPEGKRAVVDALTRTPAATWAMVGDGVNDVPALKEARLAIAQGSGAQMARSVADLVLVRDDFAVVPGMVAEGRQILRNIQRVARLFVTKSVFTAVIGAGGRRSRPATFPLLPRQFTIASTVTIGIPAFLLALAPSSGPWRPDRFLPVGRALRDPRRASPSASASSPATCSRATAFDLGLAHARGRWRPAIVVVCGLAVVMRLETRGRARRTALVDGLCARDGAAVRCSPTRSRSCATSTSSQTPTGDMVVAWAIGSAVGVAGMLLVNPRSPRREDR